jgi:hypothetical protein
MSGEHITVGHNNAPSGADQLDINTRLGHGEPEDEEDINVDGGSGGQFPSSSSRSSRFSPQGPGHASASRMSY